jgi:hypothetical protein
VNGSIRVTGKEIAAVLNTITTGTTTTIGTTTTEAMNMTTTMTDTVITTTRIGSAPLEPLSGFGARRVEISKRGLERALVNG